MRLYRYITSGRFQRLSFPKCLRHPITLRDGLVFCSRDNSIPDYYPSPFLPPLCSSHSFSFSLAIWFFRLFLLQAIRHPHGELVHISWPILSPVGFSFLSPLPPLAFIFPGMRIPRKKRNCMKYARLRDMEIILRVWIRPSVGVQRIERRNNTVAEILEEEKNNWLFIVKACRKKFISAFRPLCEADK